MAREELMEALAKRNRTELAWQRSRRAAAESLRFKEARKELKRKVKQAKAEFIAKMVAEADGGTRCYWEAVRAINGSDSRAQAVAVQKFLD